MVSVLEESFRSVIAKMLAIDEKLRRYCEP